MIAKAYSNTTVFLLTAKRPRIQPTPRIGIRTNNPLIPALENKRMEQRMSNKQILSYGMMPFVKPALEMVN